MASKTTLRSCISGRKYIEELPSTRRSTDLATQLVTISQKFLAYPEEGTCVFVLTDTKTVWSEVMKQQRFMARYRSLNGRASEYSTYNDSSCELAVVSSMHQLRHFVDAEVSVIEGSRTDLVVSIEYENQRWSWEVDSLAHRLSSSIISKHLIVPLIVTSGFAFNAASETPLVDQQAGQLQEDLDRVSKIAKRNPLLNIVQVFKRPRLTTSLRRVTAVINSVDANHLPPIVVDYDDMEEVPQDYTPDSHARAETARQREKLSSLERTLRESSAYASSLVPRPVSPPTTTFDRLSQKVPYNEDKTMYTGPQQPAQAEKKDNSATESGSEPEDLPPSKKRKVVKEGPRFQSPSANSGESPPVSRRGVVSGKARVSTDSDSDSAGPSKNRGRSARAGNSGRGTAPRVKQPLKRGGRRL